MTMTADEMKLLHTYIDECTNYLEFGSGESTLYAVNSDNVLHVDTVESSITFVNEFLMKDDIIKASVVDKLNIHTVDIGHTVDWGHPYNDEKKHLWPNYSMSIFAKKSNHDLVLVDGRFRVACILNYILNTPDNCKLLVHDFWNREQYHGVLQYLNVIDRADTMGLFIKKNDIDADEVKELIKKYQYITD